MIVRRGLPLLSTVLVILGLELASGAVSDSLVRIGRVARDLAAGEAVGVYLPAYVLGLAAIGAGLAGLAVTVWSRLTRDRIGRGTICPTCGSDTRRIRRKRRHRILSGLTGEAVQRRICGECGWKGLTRVR